jgi:hypothetical protein
MFTAVGFLPSTIKRKAPLVAAAAAVPVVNPVRSFFFIDLQSGQAETQKIQSRKHEMTKTRKKTKKFFVFSNFRGFVIKKYFHTYKKIYHRGNQLIST